MKKKLIEFKSKESKIESTLDEEVLEHGKLGNLNFKVYKRGVMHISNDSKLIFKKDCDLFETEINKINFDKLFDDEEYIIEGSGDNDNLVFKKKNGDVEILLRKKEFKIIEKLKNILNNGKK